MENHLNVWKGCFSHTNPSNFGWPLRSLLLRYTAKLTYRLPNFDMLFQFLRTVFVFIESWSRDQLMPKAYCTMGWIQPRSQGSLLLVPTEWERGGRIWDRGWAGQRFIRCIALSTLWTTGATTSSPGRFSLALGTRLQAPVLYRD